MSRYCKGRVEEQSASAVLRTNQLLQVVGLFGAFAEFCSLCGVLWRMRGKRSIPEVALGDQDRMLDAAGRSAGYMGAMLKGLRP